MILTRLYSLAVVIVFSLSSCNLSVNESIHIAAGNVANGSQNTVNGSIVVGEKAVVRGDCRTVNGRIEMGPASECGGLQTVNGEISLRMGVSAHGDVESVNGGILCEDDSKIEGAIHTVNGSIELQKSEVASDITTYSGSIRLDRESRVKGDILIRENEGSNDGANVQKIEISGSSVVEGGIIVEDDTKKVRVVLSSGGEVKGEIENAEVVRE